MARTTRFHWILLCFAGATVGGLGCSNTTTSEESTGSLSLDLELAPGIVINEVLWEIRGGDMAPMSGVIDTSAPGSTASVEVFGLPPGDDYLVELTAIDEGGELACRGDARFDVEAGTATDVMVMLNCKAAERLGGVRVEGKPNLCPELVKAVVSPLETSFGNDIDLSALAVDAEGDPFFYSWSGSGGAIDDPFEPTATFTCHQVGPGSVTIRILGGSFECQDSWTVPINCVGDPSLQMCLPGGGECSDGQISDVVPCCDLSAPDQEDACTGTESLENPTSCTATGNTVVHELTVLELAPSCNDGYDLDGCDGSSCARGGLAPGEGLDGVDSALTGIAPTWSGVGGDLGGLNQAFSDALCGLTTFQTGFECMSPIAKLRLFFFVDANLEEGCANVRVTDGLVTSDAILNLGDPTPTGTVCASGTLGTIPLTLVGFSGTLENAVVRMTVSEAGFSDGLVGATVDSDTAIAVAELLIEGGGAVMSQTFDINDELTQDTTQACNAISTAFLIGGRAQTPTP